MKKNTRILIILDGRYYIKLKIQKQARKTNTKEYKKINNGTGGKNKILKRRTMQKIKVLVLEINILMVEIFIQKQFQEENWVKQEYSA